ncbi:MAG TPA: START-like domain-containing protein [Salinivirga sp.]|uniref:START-like domain-containing protein n=1 Tax=Salinivirga sp. TaxID=1970192 RepID=UPI002B461B5F|nr:START-like domain-containing protein [Salinivirga sp.]HKK59162.1 START-like domain-containing protein [Salinivirga sp.]
MSKDKYTLEYPFNSSPKVLFNRLSTASGLSEWFADDVYVNDKTFTFVWDGMEQKAEMLIRKTPEIVKFKWLDEEEEEVSEMDPYFEFRIRKDDLTGETALLITDFAHDDDKDDAIELWDTQINALKHKLGL